MSEPQKEDQDRWRELHELLGLPADRGAAPPSPPAPAAPPAVTVHGAPQPWPPTEPEDVEEPPPAPEGGLLGEETSPPPPFEEEDVPAPLDEEETVPSAEGAAAEAPEQDRSRRGRRRGRRGRRSRSRRDEVRADDRIDDDDTEVEPTGEKSVGADASDEDERQHAELTEEAGLQAEEELQPAAAVEEEDEEPIDTFADWNVPSWQEIVASLYRPER